jgi:hypothetical protein
MLCEVLAPDVEPAMTGNSIFPHRAWEYYTAYGTGGGREGV